MSSRAAAVRWISSHQHPAAIDLHKNSWPQASQIFRCSCFGEVGPAQVGIIVLSSARRRGSGGARGFGIPRGDDLVEPFAIRGVARRPREIAPKPRLAGPHRPSETSTTLLAAN